jgi:cob(I)alamin adenosyltransferase
MVRRGYIQVYTGNGKGKTTAALGLAVRAAGAGVSVFVAQFIKKKRTGEHRALERFRDLISVRQYGRGLILKRVPDEADREAAQKGIEELHDIILSGNYGVVILDEANVAAHRNLFTVRDLLDLMVSKPKSVELVITGRYADKKVVEMADLVTEMREIKHYKEKGVKARVGIER